MIVTEDKDNYQYEERDSMNKQMKNGNSSLLHKDKDTKNKQMKRDSSSLEPEDSATVGKQMKRDSSSLEPASPPNTLKLNLLVVVSAFEWWGLKNLSKFNYNPFLTKAFPSNSKTAKLKKNTI